MASIDHLATEIYVFVDDWMKRHPHTAAWRTSNNDQPPFTDAEVITIALLLPAYAGFLRVDFPRMKRPGVLTSVLVVLLMLGGYFLVFLITPANLSWHLEVSLKRLLLHLWPAAIFLSLMIIRPPDEPSDKP